MGEWRREHAGAWTCERVSASVNGGADVRVRKVVGKWERVCVSVSGGAGLRGCGFAGTGMCGHEVRW